MKKNIIISLVVAMIFFTLGYFAGGAKVNLIGQPIKGDNTFQSGWEAAKKRLTDSGFISAAGDFVVKTISGQVTAVESDAIILKIRPLEPLADSNLDERIIKIDANTKIYILTQKDQTQYQSEIADFNKKMQEQLKHQYGLGQTSASSAVAITAPELFTKKETSLSDIKVRTMVGVVAADNDIKNTKQFNAVEIDIYSLSATATPAAAQPVK